MEILGTKYTIKENCDIEDYTQLKDNEAFTDFTTKEIIISGYDRDDNSVKDIDYHIRKVIRHEIIHAFLYESGLDCNSNWANNEEIVDWFALQYPKLKEIYKELKIED